MALLNFDASQVAPDNGALDPVPAGWYNVVINHSEIVPTKSGDGAMLKLRFNVVDGTFTGRSIFSRLNIRNANSVAQNIAHAQLSAICHAVGVINVTDSSMIHNIPLKIRVKITEQEGYSPSNDIIAYKNINEAVEMPKTQVMPSAIPPAIPPVMGSVPAPAILGQAPLQAWAQPAPVAVAPVTIPMVEPIAPVAEPVAEPAFDPSQPPAWMTK